MDVAIGTETQREYSIYSLVDPRDNQVRYVGASKNPQRRLWQHLNRSKDENNLKKRLWLEELVQHGHVPKLSIIEENLTKGEVLQREKHWIQVYLEQGASLVNMRDADLMPWELR